jgi:hypothetical protein
LAVKINAAAQKGHFVQSSQPQVLIVRDEHEKRSRSMPWPWCCAPRLTTNRADPPLFMRSQVPRPAQPTSQLHQQRFAHLVIRL